VIGTTEGTKVCAKCGNRRPFSAFSRSGKQGLKSRCKDCTAVDNKRYRAEHREQHLAYNKRWNKEHPEAMREACRRYHARHPRPHRERKENPEAVRSQKKAYYERHSDVVKARVRRWVANNPERRRLQILRDRARPFDPRGIAYVTVEKLYARHDLYGGRCFYCGKEEAETFDHRIPLTRGGHHLPSNLVPCCRSCNSRKHNRTENEWRGVMLHPR
jgi:5-methylcytosine-specific restriction endonuclease McrA